MLSPGAMTLPAAWFKRIGIANFKAGSSCTLNRHGLVGSMGRVGTTGDNAAMESFFSLLR